MKSKLSLLRSQAGMTLIEIMIVVAIIAGIVGIAGVKYIDFQEEAQIKTTRTQIVSFMQALDSYRLDNHRYPTTDQGLRALIRKPTSGKAPKNYKPGGYFSINRIPQDAWDEDYNYESDGREVKIWSNGPDGDPNTEDDIRSWEDEEE